MHAAVDKVENQLETTATLLEMVIICYCMCTDMLSKTLKIGERDEKNNIKIRQFYSRDET